ncbi:hypothetical protein U1Q18_030940, partial [Sarracenia purpurea var. burkii]
EMVLMFWTEVGSCKIPWCFREAPVVALSQEAHDGMDYAEIRWCWVESSGRRWFGVTLV